MIGYPYQYLVLRCVPRADREEFLNVGVVVYCEAAGYLASAGDPDLERLRLLDDRLEVALVRAGLDFVAAVCQGDRRAGMISRQAAGARFGFLAAPRSTVVRPGPVHGGVTTDPERVLVRLTETLVARG